MTTVPTPRPRPRMRLVLWAASGIALLALLGAALANYATILPLAGGLAAGGLFYLLARLLPPARIGHVKFALILMTAVPALLCVSLLYFGYMTTSAFIPGASDPCLGNTPPPDTQLVAYRVVISPVDFDAGEFQVLQTVIYDSIEVTCKASPGGQERAQITVVAMGLEETLPAVQVKSVEQGLFLNEVTVRPDEMFFGLPNCCAVLGQVEVKDMPAAAFQDAQRAAHLERDEYLGRESISWEKAGLEDGIRFAYIRAPFHHAHALLSPLVEFSRLNGLVFGAIGFLLVLPAAIGRMRFTSVYVGGDVGGSVVVGDENNTNKSSK